MRIHDELPTLALLTATYAGFAGILLFASVLPLLCVIVGLALVIALHSSLQHEIIHGHPTRYASLNAALVFPALGLFVPYLRFKDTHLAHHYDPNLTDPYDDPETNFLDQTAWKQMPFWQQYLAQFNNTLMGRMLIGPALSLAVFYQADMRSIWAGQKRIAFSYALHVPGIALPIGCVLMFSQLPLWAYLCAAYLAMSLLKIRTFLEHQAHMRAAARSVIIEDKGPLALLFLNNNYHAVHHAYPGVAWHKLPALFEAKRTMFLHRNGGYAFSSYAQIFRLFFLRAKDPVAHPIWTDHNRTCPKSPRP